MSDAVLTDHSSRDFTDAGKKSKGGMENVMGTITNGRIFFGNSNIFAFVSID